MVQKKLSFRVFESPESSIVLLLWKKKGEKLVVKNRSETKKLCGERICVFCIVLQTSMFFCFQRFSLIHDTDKGHYQQQQQQQQHTHTQ